MGYDLFMGCLCPPKWMKVGETPNGHKNNIMCSFGKRFIFSQKIIYHYVQHKSNIIPICCVEFLDVIWMSDRGCQKYGYAIVPV